MLLCSFMLFLGVAVAPGALAAAAPVTSRVLAPADLSGFQVQIEPHREPLAKGDACTLADPKGTVKVMTQLRRIVRTGPGRGDVTVVREQVDAYPSIRSAAAAFALADRVLEDCLGDPSDPSGGTTSARRVIPPHLAGVQDATGVVLTLTSTGSESGRTVSRRGKVRVHEFLVGRYVVTVCATAGPVTVTDTTVTSVTVDDAKTQALGVRVARLAVAKLLR